MQRIRSYRVARRRHLSEEIADSLEAPVRLLPVIAELLQDLPSLSGAERLSRSWKAARRMAHGRGLADRCQFRWGDLRTALAADSYSAVLMIALGPVLGGAAETVARLRPTIRAGGVMVIDDAYLRAAGERSTTGCDDVVATERELTSVGDEIEARLERGTSSDWFDRLTLEAIPRRAAALARERPALASDLARYVERQRFETLMIDPQQPQKHFTHIYAAPSGGRHRPGISKRSLMTHQSAFRVIYSLLFDRTLAM